MKFIRIEPTFQHDDGYTIGEAYLTLGGSFLQVWWQFRDAKRWRRWSFEWRGVDFSKSDSRLWNACIGPITINYYDGGVE